MNIQIDKRMNYLLLLGSGLAITFLLSFKVFISIDGFYYQGLAKIAVAFVLVVFFYMMQFGRFPRIIKKTVRAIAKHVMAVYYMHRLVGLILYNTPLSSLLNMRKGSFYDCFLIFLISIILAVLGSKIPLRAIKESFS